MRFRRCAPAREARRSRQSSGRRRSEAGRGCGHARPRTTAPESRTACTSSRGWSAGTFPSVRLDGIHHVTCITGDAPRNVDYYTGTLGLRLVKKSVNQDDPTVYHLFYADEDGTPGSDITFFEYPGAAPGRAGSGMIHTVVWRVASEEAVDFWRDRVGGVPFTDPEGLRHDLVVSNVPDRPLVADDPNIPPAF